MYYNFLIILFQFLGVITTWNTQYLKEQSEHTMNISVSDNVFTAYTMLVVKVTPINDHSPIFEYAKYVAHVTENTLPKDKIVRVQATDDDSGRYGDVTYHFIGDEAQKYFRISENTGNNCLL